LGNLFGYGSGVRILHGVKLYERCADRVESTSPDT
jgi:hypothetical protein